MESRHQAELLAPSSTCCNSTTAPLPHKECFSQPVEMSLMEEQMTKWWWDLQKSRARRTKFQDPISDQKHSCITFWLKDTLKAFTKWKNIPFLLSAHPHLSSCIMLSSTSSKHRRLRTENWHFPLYRKASRDRYYISKNYSDASLFLAPNEA